MTASAEVPSAARDLGARKPDFLIVGNPKSGTTALYEMLGRHPQIYTSEIKETRYFSRDHPFSPPSTVLPETLEQYCALFARASPEQRAGEASSEYLRSDVAAARIAQVLPDVRIIAILREPASFVRSLHMELLRDHVESEGDLAKAIAREDEAGRSGAVRNSTMPAGRRYSVDYVTALRRYHAVFAPEQVLVLIYEDFRADNELTLRQVLRFLDVDAERTIEPLEANPTVFVRSPRAYELVRSLYLGSSPPTRAAKAAVKALTPRRLRREGLDTLRRRVLYGQPPAPDEPLMLALRSRFKGEVVALSEYLDRDLVSFWGYDGIA
jgi:hypothetical protein